MPRQFFCLGESNLSQETEEADCEGHDNVRVALRDVRSREGEEGGRGHHRTDDAKDEYDHGEVDLFEESQEYVHVCLYEGAAGHRDGGYGVLGVGLVLLAIAKDEGRPAAGGGNLFGLKSLQFAIGTLFRCSDIRIFSLQSLGTSGNAYFLAN